MTRTCERCGQEVEDPMSYYFNYVSADGLSAVEPTERDEYLEALSSRRSRYRYLRQHFGALALGALADEPPEVRQREYRCDNEVVGPNMRRLLFREIYR